MKKLLFTAFCALSMMLAGPPADAGSGSGAGGLTTHVVNSTSRGIAMDGFDPVAYFTTGAATKGGQAFRHAYKGRTWLFASAQNRDQFAAAPEKYAPQNNGWCAWAVAHGYAAETDFINGWFIEDDKLYITWSAEVKDRFLQDKANLLAQNQANWNTVHTGLQEGSVKFVSHSQRPNLGFQHPQQMPDS